MNLSVPRFLIVLILLSLILPVGRAQAQEPSTVRVGFVLDGPWALNETVLEQTRREIVDLTSGEFAVRFEDRHTLIGDWTLDGARRNLLSLLGDPEVDLVIAWGVLASHASCCLGELAKPVIAPVIIDSQLQGLPALRGSSGVRNLAYVALPDNLLHELLELRDVVPFDRIAFLLNASLYEELPGLEDRTRGIAAQAGVEIEFVPVSGRAREALAALDSLDREVDAVYVWPLGELREDEMQGLIDGLLARRLPAFSGLGRLEVEAGMLASLVSDELFPKLSRRIALNVQRILLGEDAGSIPFAFDVPDRLTLNMATARAIGVSPRWEILLEADTLYAEETDGVSSLSLPEAVRLAVEANLDLAAQRLAVEAGAEEIRRARSELLPTIETSLGSVRIDEDRAEASGGAQPERSLTASATVRQLLYSDGAWANLDVQRRLQDARGYGLEALRLDIALDAAVAYLDLLRAQTLLQVERNNLVLTRSNLERAAVRRSIGAANPAEVYRWESAIAGDRNALVRAGAQVRSAAIAVNRLLQRPLDEAFLTEEVDLETSELITAEDRFSGFVETPLHFATFQEFGVAEGLAAAPELQQLLASIEAQKRLVEARRRAYWVPNLGASFSLDETLDRSDAPPPGFPQADDTSWSLGLSATLNLFQGGARAADRAQAELDLERLRLEWRSASEKIEQRIRSASIATRASYAGIDLSRQAAEAARRNLELVADSYARGAVPILDLLDAQNAALNAEQNAANSTYDFLIDLMQVQRASNQFDFFISSGARTAWFERLELWFREAGVERWRPAGSSESAEGE